MIGMPACPPTCTSTVELLDASRRMPLILTTLDRLAFCAVAGENALYAPMIEAFRSLMGVAIAATRNW